MDFLPTLGVSLVGGTAGTLLTLFAAVPAQVRYHDRQIADVDEDLGLWVSDDMVRLEREANELKLRYLNMRQHTAGAYPTALAHPRSRRCTTTATSS